MLETNNDFALLLFHFFHNCLPSRIIVIFKLAHIEHLVGVENELGNENQVRQEIYVYLVGYQTLRLQYISLFVSFRLQSVKSSICKHDITPLSLEHAHDVLGLEFVSLDRPVEYALLVTLQYGLVLGINENKLILDAQPLRIEMRDGPAPILAASELVIALLLTRIGLVLRGRVINVV